MSEPAALDISTLGPAMRLKRQRLRLSIRAAAAEIGIPTTSYARIEHGHANPDLQPFVRIVNWLGLPIEHFFARPAPVGNVPDLIAHYLRIDPRLSDNAARSITATVDLLYAALADRKEAHA